MTAYLTVVAALQDRTIDSLRNELDGHQREEAVRRAITEINSVASMARRGYIYETLHSVTASTTVACDQSAAVLDTDDITIGGTVGGTISVATTPATEDDMALGSTDIEFAANLVAAINAHSTISKLVYAVSDGVDTVTVYSIHPGPIGNLITMAETGSGFVLGAAVLEDGAGDEVDGLSFGYNPKG